MVLASDRHTWLGFSLAGTRANTRPRITAPEQPHDGFWTAIYSVGALFTAKGAQHRSPPSASVGGWRRWLLFGCPASEES
jgi:hypothetical protein